MSCNGELMDVTVNMCNQRTGIVPKIVFSIYISDCVLEKCPFSRPALTHNLYLAPIMTHLIGTNFYDSVQLVAILNVFNCRIF